jgi:transposase
LHFHGIDIPEQFATSGTHWSKRFNEWLSSIDMTEQSGKNSLDAFISITQNLRASILKVTRQIHELSKTECYSSQIILLRSVPGIGLLTAMIILTELETITRFESFDKLCGFIGLVPSTHSSGENDIVGGITPRGHSVLRSSIIESAWVAVRNDPALMKSYHDYCKRMEANKAIIRIARKLLNRIRYVLKNKQPYEYSIVM